MRFLIILTYFENKLKIIHIKKFRIKKQEEIPFIWNFLKPIVLIQNQIKLDRDTDFIGGNSIIHLIKIIRYWIMFSQPILNTFHSVPGSIRNFIQKNEGENIIWKHVSEHETYWLVCFCVINLNLVSINFMYVFTIISFYN